MTKEDNGRKTRQLGYTIGKEGCERCSCYGLGNNLIQGVLYQLLLNLKAFIRNLCALQIRT